MAELATVRPAIPPDARFTPPEYRAFCMGWTGGLGRALRVMRLTEEREACYRSTRRAATREKRAAG